MVAAPMRHPLGRSSKPERASSASPVSARNWPGANGAVTVDTEPAGPALVVASPRLTRLAVTPALPRRSMWVSRGIRDWVTSSAASGCARRSSDSTRPRLTSRSPSSGRTAFQASGALRASFTTVSGLTAGSSAGGLSPQVYGPRSKSKVGRNHTSTVALPSIFQGVVPSSEPWNVIEAKLQPKTSISMPSVEHRSQIRTAAPSGRSCRAGATRGHSRRRRRRSGRRGRRP